MGFFRIALSWVFVLLALAACDPAKTGLEGRAVPPPANKPDGQEKPDPDSGKIDKIENFEVISFQAPTSDADKFENDMTLDLTQNAEAWFTFTFAPKKDGHLYFNSKYIKLTLECESRGPQRFSRRIYWQEYSKNTRRVISELSEPTAAFEYKAGKFYALTYALTKLREEFPTCQVGNLKLAVFE